MSVVKTVNEFLDKIGGSAQGNFKIYATNSRTHLFLKAENLPGKPAVDFSVDLPGDLDSVVADVANAGLAASGLGNSSEGGSPSNG